jgi:hypothetical protein
MPTRAITIDGKEWRVYPSGRVTPYTIDEFGLVFVRQPNGEREVRITRYSPHGTRSRESSLAELSDEHLRELFAQSQPSFTSPEAGYAP